MRVFLLDGGTMMIDRSQLLWNVDCGVRLRFPVYSVLVEHDDGLFLFDTGYDLEHVRRVFPKEEPQQSEAQGIVQQLALCGFAPGDVSYVVNSHLHFDHVGGNRHFPEPRRSCPRPSCARRRCRRRSSATPTPTRPSITRAPTSSCSRATSSSQPACGCSRRRATRPGTTRS